MPRMTLADVTMEYIRERVIVDSNECWIWQRSKIRAGYGNVCIDGKMQYAHRVAFYIKNGHFPQIGRHSCDVKACCNPDHILDGTQIDNARDAVERGQIGHGQKNYRAKLTDEEALYIRSSNERGKDLAERFGVSQTTITEIRNGTRWKWIKS